MRPLERSIEKLDDVRRKKLSEMISGSEAGTSTSTTSGLFCLFTYFFNFVLDVLMVQIFAPPRSFIILCLYFFSLFCSSKVVLYFLLIMAGAVQTSGAPASSLEVSPSCYNFLYVKLGESANRKFCLTLF